MTPMGTRVCVVWNSLRCNYNLSNLEVQSWVGSCVPFIITLSNPAPKAGAYKYKELPIDTKKFPIDTRKLPIGAL